MFAEAETRAQLLHSILFSEAAGAFVGSICMPRRWPSGPSHLNSRSRVALRFVAHRMIVAEEPQCRLRAQMQIDFDCDSIGSDRIDRRQFGRHAGRQAARRRDGEKRRGVERRRGRRYCCREDTRSRRCATGRRKWEAAAAAAAERALAANANAREWSGVDRWQCALQLALA